MMHVRNRPRILQNFIGVECTGALLLDSSRHTQPLLTGDAQNGERIVADHEHLAEVLAGMQVTHHIGGHAVGAAGGLRA